MPNFKLGSGIKDDIRNNASKLAQRRVDHMTGTFPLTALQVQNAIMPAEHLKSIRWLKSENVVGVSHQTRIYVRLAPDYMPGLSRAALAQLHMPDGVYPAKSSNWWGSGTQYVPNVHTNDLTLNEGELDDEARDAVISWTHKAIKERRLQAMSNNIVSGMLDRVQSSGEILARWPFLATLVPDESPSNYGNANANLRLWKNRLRNGPRDLRRYANTPSEMNRKFMEATEVFLGSAQMLDPYQHAPDTIRSEMVAWEKLPTDRI